MDGLGRRAQLMAVLDKAMDMRRKRSVMRNPGSMDCSESFRTGGIQTQDDKLAGNSGLGRAHAARG